MVKAGAGTWIFSGQGGSFSGGTQVNEGTLEIANNATLGPGSVALMASGTLQVASGLLEAGPLSGAGGTLVLGNAPVAGFTSFSRPSGGGLVIVPSSITALGVTQKVGANSGFTVVNGIVDGSIVAQSSPTDSSGDFLNYNTNNGLLRATYSAATAITNGVSGGTTPTAVFHATASTNNNVTFPTTLYALKVDSGVSIIGGAPLMLGDGMHTAGVIINGGRNRLPPTF